MNKNKDKTRSEVFSRRALLIGALQALAITGLIGRLAYLQIKEGRKYRMLSDKNRINTKIVAPSRGVITDRNGIYLANNQRNYQVLIIAEQADGVEVSLRKLQKIIDLSENDISEAIERSKSVASFIPVKIRDSLKWHEVARIEANLTDLPGILVDTGEKRIYPHGYSTAHLVGYVGSVNRTELKENDPVLGIPGIKTGKTGIERAYEKDLRGVAGTVEVEVNASGREVRKLAEKPAKQGKKIILTVDSELQKYVQSVVDREKSATAVIMDAKNGAVYSLASGPAFDANMFVDGISARDWEELLSNPALPLNNKAVAGQYPPGSTFKMITALTALEKNIINQYTTVDCRGSYRLGKDLFHCWNRGGHGKVDLVDALAESCDVYFYEISSQTDIDDIAQMAMRFGLGSRLDFELKEESPGLVPSRAWKMGHFGKKWQPGETIVASIGQGYLQATPLQLATMTARMVNGGYAVKPWITLSSGDELNNNGINGFKKIGIDESHLNLVKKGMDKAVLHRKGTAHGSAIEQSSMAMGGKTGTSQVRRISRQERLEGFDNADMPWRLRHHALFVGYAPVDNPRYVCAVVVEHGGSGSKSAAPLAKDLLIRVQQLNPADKKFLGVIR